MSKQPIFAWDLPDEHGDLAVTCTDAVYAKVKDGKTEPEGVNFNEATVRTSRAAGGQTIAAGNLYVKWPGNESSLTNPFRLSKNDKGYWKAYPLDGQPPLAIKPPPAPKPQGGNWKGGSKSIMTREQLDAAIAYSINATEQTVPGLFGTGDDFDAGDDAVAAVFAKILGCAMFVEWPTDPTLAALPGGTPDDEDIPF